MSMHLRSTESSILPINAKLLSACTAKETFARIPHERGLKLYGRIGAAAWAVLIELDRQILKPRKNPIHLTNQNLEAVGMSRSTKKKALRQLQNAGVIICGTTRTRSRPRHTPVVSSLPRSVCTVGHTGGTYSSQPRNIRVYCRTHLLRPVGYNLCL